MIPTGYAIDESVELAREIFNKVLGAFRQKFLESAYSEEYIAHAKGLADNGSQERVQ